MATRNLIMVVDRKHARGSAYGLAIHPEHVSAHSYVNMYHHHDGYPEWQAVQIANWLNVNNRQDGSALAAKLVHDMYYDSCYLYSDEMNVDHQYTYIIWTGDKNRTFHQAFKLVNDHVKKVTKDQDHLIDLEDSLQLLKINNH